MRIYLFRGLLGNFFSLGMDKLAKRLRKEGHIVTVHGWMARRSVQRKAIKEFKARKANYIIMVGGHSLGGNSANYMSNNLVRAGVPVRATFTWDATAPRKHLGKGEAHNFMSSDFRAQEVPGATDHHFDNLSHIQVDKDQTTHDLVVSYANGLA